jgi:hypothetical protein
VEATGAHRAGRQAVSGTGVRAAADLAGDVPDVISVFARELDEAGNPIGEWRCISGTCWYLATCVDCVPILPQPFRDRAERDEWAGAHATTGHRVRLHEQLR